MISFSGYKENVITFLADSSVTKGAVVTMKENGTVKKADAGDKFIGVALSVREGLAAVQTDGYVELAFSGSTDATLGFSKLVADGDGGVKVDSSGNDYLTINTQSDSIGFVL